MPDTDGPSLDLRMFPAREGDALWLTWGPTDDRRHMLVDMGTEATGRALNERLAATGGVHFELLVVTHIDRDHIGGVLAGLVTPGPPEGTTFGDIWFNGYDHLHGRTVASELEPLGAVQGEALSRWLESRRWNTHFQGYPVWVTGDEFPRVTLEGGLTVTVLGPTRERLEQLEPTWVHEVREAFAKGRVTEADLDDDLREIVLESLGPPPKPVLDTLEDLQALADQNTGSDGSKANGSSIALLVEYRETRLLLAGDAWGPDLAKALLAVGDGEPLRLDGFKVPHHGSAKNVSADLVAAVDCDRWLVSTDGNRFQHPDAQAVARILLAPSSGRKRLEFNVRSPFNGWWADPDWMTRFQYDVRYGDPANGLLCRWPDA